MSADRFGQSGTGYSSSSREWDAGDWGENVARDSNPLRGPFVPGFEPVMFSVPVDILVLTPAPRSLCSALRRFLHAVAHISLRAVIDRVTCRGVSSQPWQ